MTTGDSLGLGRTPGSEVHPFRESFLREPHSGNSWGFTWHVVVGFPPPLCASVPLWFNFMRLGCGHTRAAEVTR